MSEVKSNTDKLSEIFNQFLTDSGNQGVVGVVSFGEVFDNLIPIQKEHLKMITGELFPSLQASGCFISIALAYHDPSIDHINKKDKGIIDMRKWNEYGDAYAELNATLNTLAYKIASEFNGIVIPATFSNFIEKAEHVSDDFKQTVSHRAIAEHAGIGWRGKNGLIIHEKYSCAIRFASIITKIPLIAGERLESRCRECTACEDACTFIKHRTKLKDYRENCRRYIIHLQSQGLQEEVCGKCILACYRNSLHKDRFTLTD